MQIRKRINVGVTIREEASTPPLPQPIARLQNLIRPMRSQCLNPSAANRCLSPAVTTHHILPPRPGGTLQNLHQPIKGLLSPQVPLRKLRKQPIRRKKQRVPPMRREMWRLSQNNQQMTDVELLPVTQLRKIQEMLLPPMKRSNL